ncbi:Immunoglobulin A1 protease precursor [Limihaloglobus sulfuriphilus]|uniref:Immunoglobulin A1 protease n=1 Tax=Limihaloglobus sulfuriphilus TaxID=1851148 RepID=A0A1Q2MIM9_9BACT|nr:GLUG motif-containing protein [Limihaloglobus sulfuriphilus]AQQ72519.1 Immunoglobulin A1 protease precursor [Limihaloglobus sulfuriphilus]
MKSLLSGVIVLVCFYLFSMTSIEVLGAGGNLGGGDGSPETPYLIEDMADFNVLASAQQGSPYLFADYVLMVDLDLSGTVYTSAVIGSYSGSSYGDGAFNGSFDGNGHVISNLTIESESGYAGLFSGIFKEGSLSNLTLENADITASGDNVGILCGSLLGDMTDCHASGSISNFVAGDRSFRTGGLVGGFAGFGKTMLRCSADVYIRAQWQVGGLVGSAGSLGAAPVISQCWANIDIDGESNVGGLVGSAGRYIEILNCYVTGSVPAINYFGGITGRNQYTVRNCYSSVGLTEALPSGWVIGGLCGYQESYNYLDTNCTFDHCRWNLDSSSLGQITVAIGETYGGGYSGYTVDSIGLTEAEMAEQQSFLDAGWDFVGEDTNGTEDIWKMPLAGGYPILAWQVELVFTVPDCSGLSITDAQQLITGEGFTVGELTYAYSDTAAKDNVISQTLAAGTQFLEDQMPQTIGLEVSLGKDCNNPVPADFNGDCTVDSADLAIFAGYWLHTD